MHTLKQKPPPGRVGASEIVHAGSENNQNYSRQHEKSQARLAALYPHLPSETLELRATLATAESVCLGRISAWPHWSADLHKFHFFAALWAGRASRSNWPEVDLKKALDGARHALLAASAFAGLMDKYDE